MPISPNQGSIGGGQSVMIAGVNLLGAQSVLFGDTPATITSNTPTSITVITPAGNGVVEVVVTTGGGPSNSLFYYYIPPPIITSLSQTSGSTAGGNTIFINGRYLSTAFSVNCGSNQVPTIINDAQISFVVPGGSSGQVNVNVVTAGGSSSTLLYTYLDAPTVSSLMPNSGSIAGGQTVTIGGSDLSTTNQVTFGGTFASFGVISSTEIVAITPFTSVAGAVDVVVTTTGGSSTSSGGYTYTS